MCLHSFSLNLHYQTISTAHLQGETEAQGAEEVYLRQHSLESRPLEFPAQVPITSLLSAQSARHGLLEGTAPSKNIPLNPVAPTQTSGNKLRTRRLLSVSFFCLRLKN